MVTCRAWRPSSLIRRLGHVVDDLRAAAAVLLSMERGSMVGAQISLFILVPTVEVQAEGSGKMTSRDRGVHINH
jgi:hypothetical protein